MNKDGVVQYQEFISLALEILGFGQPRDKGKGKGNKGASPSLGMSPPATASLFTTPDTSPGEKMNREEAETAYVVVMSGRAEKKWDELDVDRNGMLVGDEVLALAKWAWSSFRPGEAITVQEKIAEVEPNLTQRNPTASIVVTSINCARWLAHIQSQLAILR